MAILFIEWVEHVKGTLQFLRENTSWLYHKIICMWSIKILVKTLPTYTKTTRDISVQQTFHRGLCAAQYAIIKALSFNFHFHSILCVMKFKPLLILQASPLVIIWILKGFHLYIYGEKQWHFLNAIYILVNLSKIASHFLGKLSKILSDLLSDFYIVLRIYGINLSMLKYWWGQIISGDFSITVKETWLSFNDAKWYLFVTCDMTERRDIKAK